MNVNKLIRRVDLKCKSFGSHVLQNADAQREAASQTIDLIKVCTGTNVFDKGYM